MRSAALLQICLLFLAIAPSVSHANGPGCVRVWADPFLAQILKRKASALGEMFEISERYPGPENEGLRFEFMKEVMKVMLQQKRDGVAFMEQLLTGRDFLTFSMKMKLSQSHLVELVKGAAELDGGAVAEHFAYFSTWSPADKFQIAKAAALEDGTAVSVHISGLKIDDLAHRSEIARVIAAPYGWTLSQNYKDFEIHDPAETFEIIKIVASNDQAFAALEFLQNFEGLTRAQVFEVAKLVASRDPYQTAIFFRQLGVLDTEQKYKIAKIAATSPVPQSIEIPMLLREIFRFDLPIEERDRIASALARTHVLNWYNEIEGIGVHDLRVPELKNALKKGGQHGIPIIPLQVVDLAWDRVERRETGLAIIQQSAHWMLEGKSLPDDSTIFVLETVGIPHEQAVVSAKTLQKKLSINSLSDLYDLLLDFQSSQDRPIFEGVTIAPKLWDRNSKLSELMERLRDLAELEGRDAWPRVRERLGITGITPENISELLAKASRELETRIREVLQSGEFSLSAAQYDDLIKEWGNLRTIMTLIARFQGRANWQKELPSLGRVFQAILKREFLKLKFETSEALLQQASLATSRQRTAWQKVRTLARVFRPEVQAGAEEMRALLLEELGAARTQAALHLSEASPRHRELRPSADLIQEVLNKKTSSVDLVKAWPQEKRDLLAVSLSYALERTTDPVQIQKLVSFTRDVVSARLTGLPQEVNQALLLDLATVQAQLDKLKGAQGPSHQGPSVMVATTFHDPKLLLEIGSLVKGVSSCQDYSIGTHIETLLGYVMDANVQGAMIFDVQAKNLENPAQFELLTTQKIKKTDFDPRTMTVTFTLANGATVRTQGLEARQRNVIKLGQVVGSEEPGLFAEKAYRNERDPGKGLAMETFMKDLVKAIARGTSARTGVRIRMTAGSVNPGGVYSDAGGGVRTDAYEVGP